MPYLIDGHNLIPKIPGLSLAAPDDEMQLVELLQEFCRRERKQAEVYFDNAPPGQPRTRSYGTVLARFVRSGQTADAAMRERLARLGASARNWTVISSDQEVLRSAKAARSRMMTSEAFSRHMAQVMQAPEAPSRGKNDPAVTPDELDEWLDMFGDEAKE